MFEEENKEKDRIEGIKNKLYSKNMSSVDGTIKRHSVGLHKPDLPTAWDNTDLEKESTQDFPFMKVLLIALLFFFTASGFAFYKFFFGANVISGNNIDVVVRGPVSVGGGESLPMDIEIINNNTTLLESVNLHIEYPTGMTDPNNPSTELKRYDTALGDISVGKNVTQTINALVFGEENSQKDVNITVEYRIPGSSGIFYKNKTFSFLISSSPVNLTVVNSSEVNANQKTDFNIEVKSNSLTIVKNLALRADYPFGFDYKSSDITPSVGNNIWNLGDFEPGAIKKIKISGLIAGQDGEEKVFKFNIGMPDKLDNRSITTSLASFTTSIFVRKPFVNLVLSTNGDISKEVAILSGKSIKNDIILTNNLSDTIYDLETDISIQGLILDKTSVSVNGGIYQSIDNQIVFNKQTNSSFTSLAPGENINSSFNFSAFSSMSKTGSIFNNPSITFNVSVRGRRTDSASTQKEVFYSETKTIKIISDIALLARGYYFIGPFKNIGPIPPKAEKETTYTITWTATNPTNNVTNTKVSSSLPSYMKWVGVSNTSSEDISYDSASNQIVWNIGNIQAGAGTTLPVREVSFQISFTPSLSQVGDIADILNESIISGVDSFTGTTVTQKKQAITTEIKTDPNMSDKGGIVVQ
ncbi:MAG: hypothetical protein WCC74_01075 [Minisyncoccia bacterium]